MIKTHTIENGSVRKFNMRRFGVKGNNKISGVTVIKQANIYLPFLLNKYVLQIKIITLCENAVLVF